MNGETATINCSTIFSNRDKILQEMGFLCYADYLQSDLWMWIRSTLDDPRECVCCGSRTGLCWHHREYTLPIMVGNFCECPAKFSKVTPLSGPIVRVCGECHRAIHFGPDWHSMDVVDVRLVELWRRIKVEQKPALAATGALPTGVVCMSPGGF